MSPEKSLWLYHQRLSVEKHLKNFNYSKTKKHHHQQKKNIFMVKHICILFSKPSQIDFFAARK